MTTLRATASNKKYTLNAKGFLAVPSEWDKEFTETYAQKEGVTLTEEHWKIINYLRKYYSENGICPLLRRLTKDTGLTLRQIYDLFPDGPAQMACKWAGLPSATGCVM